MSSNLFTDMRGTLFFPVKENHNFSQCTVSVNKKNVFRGIHINQFEKLVTCIQGRVLDIIVNFDEKASDYLIPKYYYLDPKTSLFQLHIPKNYGHAFLSLEEDSILIYHLSDIFKEETTMHINYLDPWINIELPIDDNTIILSEKDKQLNFVKPIDYLIFGSNGFLGSNVTNFLGLRTNNFIKSNLRLQNTEKIEKVVSIFKPKYIINCAGITGTPNIFWCDENKTETIENNITYQLTLAAICKKYSVHLTILGSGGIFENRIDKIYEDQDEGNNYDTFYGITRIYLESIIKNYDNILYLRINYPISSTPSQKNLLTKLLSYNTIKSQKFSITYIDNLFPILFEMIENNETGICNFTNPGIINIVDIVKTYYKTNNICKDFSIDSSLDSDKRSIPTLHSNILKKYNPKDINEVIIECSKNYHEKIITKK